MCMSTRESKQHEDKWLGNRSAVLAGLCRRAVVTCLVPVFLVVGAGSLFAQPLNLDQNTSAASGNEAAAKALAESLESQIKSIEKGEALSPQDAVRVALRQAAATLIRLGSREGSKGSVHVLIGSTIAARIAALDAALDGEFATLDATTLRGVARDLNAIGLDASPTAYESVEVVDRTLRDALAPLVQAAGPAMASRGWMVASREGGPSTSRASLADLARALALSAEATKTFGDLDARLDLADRWISFEGWAGEVREMVRSAALVASSTRLAWLSEAAYGVLRVELVRSVTTLAAGRQGTERAAARVGLQKLAALGEFVRVADTVDATASGRSTRTLRTAMSELVASPAWATESGIDARIERVSEILSAIVRGAEDTPERTVARQFRPALLALEPAARQASVQLLDVLPRVVRRSDSMSDPAVLAAITVYTRRVADFKLVGRMSDLVTGSVSAPGAKRVDAKAELAASDPLRPIADRALLLGQSFLKADKRDAALTEFRDLAEQLEDYVELPGEKELRTEIQPGIAPGDWAAVTGSREKKLVAALGEARSRWLSERSLPRTPTVTKASTWLAQFRGAIGLFRDTVAVRSLAESIKADRADQTLQAWPGWEISGEALAALCAGLTDQTGKLAEQIVSGDEKGAAKSLADVSKDYAVVTMVARLDRSVRSRSTAEREPLANIRTLDALGQIALAPPLRDAWIADERDELASICRAAQELARAESRGDSAAGKLLRTQVNRTASAVMARLDTEPR